MATKEMVKIGTMDMNQVFFLKRLSKFINCIFESVPNFNKCGYTLVRFKNDKAIPYKQFETIKEKFKLKYGKDLIIQNEKLIGFYSYSITIKQ